MAFDNSKDYPELLAGAVELAQGASNLVGDKTYTAALDGTKLACADGKVVLTAGAVALSDSAAVEVSGVGTVLSGSVGQILYAGEGFSWMGENTYLHRVKSLGV